nr:phage tail protein [Cloacibacillus evryensis]
MVRTFSDLQQKSAARYAEHEVIGKKPVLEFLGPGLEEISFKVQLLSSLGVDPDKEIKVLQEMRDAGEVGQLIFGETKIGKFVITDLSASEGPRDKQGAPTWIEAEINIKEYIEHGK